LQEIEKYYNFEINKINKSSVPNIKRNVKLPTMKPTSKQVFNPINTQATNSLAQNININPQNVIINHDGYKASVRNMSDMNINTKKNNNVQVNSPRMTKLKKDIANLQIETGNTGSSINPSISNIRYNSTVEAVANVSEHVNMMRGVVKSKTDKAISNAVINILDSTNQLIRRLMSDNLGKFILKNPL